MRDGSVTNQPALELSTRVQTPIATSGMLFHEQGKRNRHVRDANGRSSIHSDLPPPRPLRTVRRPPLVQGMPMAGSPPSAAGDSRVITAIRDAAWGNMAAGDRPRRSTARYEVLARGYVGRRVASTVSLVEDGEVRLVIDPGMVRDRRAILAPLARRGLRPEEITDVVISHHHPDHTLNCALFPEARVHDYWAIYRADRWEGRPAEGFEISPSILLWETPGHTPQDVTTLVGTPEGIVAFTHLWWTSTGPTPDPLASDNRAIRRHRRRVLSVASRIVPAHGAPFVPRRGRSALPRSR